jgi:acyl carrier protein
VEQDEDTSSAQRVFQSVRALLESKFTVSADVRPESKLVSDLGIDRLDADEFPLVLEEAFEIDISNDDAERISTVEDVVRCVLRCRGQS